MTEFKNDADGRGPHAGNTDDPRSDIEKAVQSRADEADAATDANPTSPLEPTGVPDGVGGTAGEVKNQDRAQQ